MDYDVIIVGARVAGSSLAVLLGRRGLRVLLVDRDQFPSDTLSTHLLQPPAVEMLDRLGALADVEALGLRRLGRLRTYLGDSVVEGAIRAPGAYALCARRDRLDMILIQHALRHPSVAFMEQTRVGGLLWEEGRVAGVRLRTKDGTQLEPGVDCLALEVQPEEFSVFRADPAGRFEAAIRTLPGMTRRLAGAEREGSVRGIGGVENFLRVPYGPGWALTGDAAYLKDPSTGMGIEDAFRQAFLLAEALGAALDGADWEATMAAYQQRRDEAVLPSYRSTLTYTRAGDVPAEALAWLQAVVANAGLVRLLGHGLPAAVQSGGLFPPGLVPTIERSAHRFLAAADVSTRVRSAA